MSERRGETKPLRARVGERGARRAAHPVSRTDTRACAKCSEGELRRTTRPPRRRQPNTCPRKGTFRLTSSRRPGSPNSPPQTISKSGCSPRRELGVLEVVMPWKAARAGVSDEQDTRHFTQNGRIAPVRTCDGAGANTSHRAFRNGRDFCGAGGVPPTPEIPDPARGPWTPSQWSRFYFLPNSVEIGRPTLARRSLHGDR